jgi:membrane protease YdiL (CAAX protease family)
MKKGVEEEVVVGRPFYILWAGFFAATVLTLIYAQGVLGQVEGVAVTMLLIGMGGLLGGYVVNMAYLRRADIVTTEDANNVLNFGVGGFVVLTLYNSLTKNFAKYQSAMSQQGIIVTLAAAPFEEAMFRLCLAAAVYRGMLYVVPSLRRSVGGLFGTRNYYSGPANIDRYIAMGLTALFIGWFFVEAHAAVGNISDPLVSSFYFSNSFVYTLLFLYTGNIMVSTTAHLLHNGAVIFFALFAIPII